PLPRRLLADYFPPAPGRWRPTGFSFPRKRAVSATDPYSFATVCLVVGRTVLEQFHELSYCFGSIAEENPP
ncbi:hypothetical protein NAG16_13560, partial [Pseudomonas aeruginosa]|nr:hypothetical protein [Pseudomonas aeruginosa]